VRPATLVVMAAKDELGRRGEDLAVAYLEQQGLVVLDRNWRCRHGELDVICTDRERLVVCEVKTRTSTRYGSPAEAVDERKVRRIRRLANLWLAAHHVCWVEIRFDVLAVLAPPGAPARIQHYRAAF
jgi:putative endonuclease